jgi:hypothetical protein
MKAFANLDSKPSTIMIRIVTSKPKKFYLKVSDAEKENTIFTNRYCTIDNEQSLFIRMPLAPKKAEILIKSEDELNGVKDYDYKVVEMRKLPLKRKLTAFNHANQTIRKFVKFAEEFSAKAGYISAKGSVYSSDDGQFRIDYLDDIIGDNGKSLKTPARISRNEGVIEVSKLKFSKYSVPMRIAILLHEFSHFYLNTDMANETEADLNGLIIYLGLGYPRIDAYNVFTQVFHTSPTELNKDRMKIIDDFIRNFENKYLDMQYTPDSLYKNYI